MPSRIQHPEWRSSLEDTKYPFSPTMTLTNSDGISLPVKGLIDAHLYPIGGKDGIHMSQVSVTHEAVIFYIGDEANSSIASGRIEISSFLATPVDKRGAIVQIADNYGRPAGILISTTIGLASFAALGVGDYTFLQEQTEFVATACMPTPEVGVRGVILPDGTVMPESLSDELWFVGGDGVILTYELNTSAGKCSSTVDTFPTIRVDAVGDPLFLRKLCATPESEEDDTFATPAFIKTIRVQNNIKGCDELPTTGPDEISYWDIDVKEREGRLFIQGNDALTVHTALRVRTTDEGTIEISIAGSPNYKV